MKNRKYSVTARLFSFAAALFGATALAQVAASNTGSLAASLNAAETVRTIQAQPMESRAQLFVDLNGRIATGLRAMADLRETSAKLDREAKANFTAAANDVKEKENALHDSIKAADKADAATWAETRAKLATDFEAYASAIARAEAACQTGAKAGEIPKN